MKNTHEANAVKSHEINTQKSGKGKGGPQIQMSKVRAGSGKPNGRMPGGRRTAR